MPSTDIDGSPIVILSAAEAREVLELLAEAEDFKLGNCFIQDRIRQKIIRALSEEN